MTTTQWAPQIARAMHELSNAAPAPPTAASLRDRETPASRSPRVAVTLAAAAITAATVVGLAVVMDRDDKTSVSGPSPAVDVTHTQIEIALAGELECDTPIDTTGSFATMVVDTYSDRTGRQWRNHVTYPDGTTVDLIATGSAAYPTGLFQRGNYRGSSLGCLGPNEERFVLAGDPTPGGFFTLNLSDELSPDERPFVLSLDEVAVSVDGEYVDSLGRPSQLWEQRIEGTAGYTVANHDVLQITNWWVSSADGRTVTERRFSNTVDQLGSATETLTLVANETITVPADFFDTMGYQKLATSPRPTMNGSPTDDTIVTATPPLASDAVLLPDSTMSGVAVVSDETYGALSESRGAVLAPDYTVFGFALNRTGNAEPDRRAETRIVNGHTVNAVVDGSAPAEIYRTVVTSCATLVVITAEEGTWSEDTLALFGSVTFDGANVSVELPAGWTDLGSSPARPQHIVKLSVNSQGHTVQLFLQQMADVPAGWFLSGNETAPRAIDIDGSTAWLIDGATTPGLHSIVGERDGIAFQLSGMISADELTEIARSLRATSSSNSVNGTAVVVEPDTSSDSLDECGGAPSLTVHPFVQIVPVEQRDALSDGVVTLQEYQAAFNRVSDVRAG